VSGASQSLERLLDAVDLLAPALAEGGLDELEVEVEELSVRLARPRATTSPAAAPAQPVSGGPAASAAASPFGEPTAGMRFVSAPLTGVWYSAPSPGARPYVQANDELAPGQVVGLIEAMKLFNEIKSDVGGRVNRVLAENGTLVKRHQPLLEVDPRA
jgi:acetyl-CoA carboxylase biotin carboxyl carrier protein